MTNVHTSHITLNFRVPRPNGLLVEEEPASRKASSPDRERPLDGQGDTQATASEVVEESINGMATNEPPQTVAGGPTGAEEARNIDFIAMNVPQRLMMCSLALMTLSDLDSMPRPQLKALTQQHGLRGYTNKKKSEMVQGLRVYFAANPGSLPRRAVASTAPSNASEATSTHMVSTTVAEPAPTSTLNTAVSAETSRRTNLAFPTSTEEDSDNGPPSDDEVDTMGDTVDETLPIPSEPSHRIWEEVHANHPPLTLHDVTSAVPSSDGGKPAPSIACAIRDEEHMFSALKAFEYFITPSILEHISQETRVNASLKQAQAWREQPNADHAREWTSDMCSPKNLMLWIGVTMHMGLSPKPGIHHYWSKDVIWDFDMTSKSGMTRKHYEQIRRFFHCNDNSKWKPKGQPGYDPLFKVRPVLNMFSEVLKTPWVMGRCISVDEMMIKYKVSLLFLPNPDQMLRWLP